MSKVTFDYDIKKDAWSWVLIAKDKNCWGLDWKNQIAHIPSNLLSEIERSPKDEAISKVERYLQSNHYKDLKQEVIKVELNSIKETWGLIELKYFRTLESITGKAIYQKEFPCYMTTGFMCPYNTDKVPHWFMTSFWHSIPSTLTTIAHEIFHLQFLNY